MIINTRSRTFKEIRNTRRVDRTLKLLVFLNDTNGKTIKECSNQIGVHEKTIFNYLNLFTQLGFVIEVLHRKRNYYRISNLKEFFKIE
ncbi:hypothetical protein [Emticicia fontis]